MRVCRRINIVISRDVEGVDFSCNRLLYGGTFQVMFSRLLSFDDRNTNVTYCSFRSCACSILSGRAARCTSISVRITGRARKSVGRMVRIQLQVGTCTTGNYVGNQEEGMPPHSPQGAATTTCPQVSTCSTVPGRKQAAPGRRDSPPAVEGAPTLALSAAAS